MAEYKEKTLWQNIRNGTKKFNCHWTRIENQVDSGVPDTWLTYLARTVPIELKVEESGYAYFRPAQISWMFKNYRSGGNPKIALKLRDGDIVIIRFCLEFKNKLIEKGKYLALPIKEINLDWCVYCFKPMRYDEMLKEMIR